MSIYGNTHSQPLHVLQNRLMDVYQIWKGLSSHCRHMCLGFLSDLSWGGSKAGQEGVKESFKDKSLYLKCCHSGSGFDRYSKGWIRGGAKKGRGMSSPLTKSSFSPNVHSNILMYCRRHCRHTHLFESCHSGCLFSSPEPKARVSFCHSAPSVVHPSVVRPPASVVRL